MVRGRSSATKDITDNAPCRRGPKEKYTESELREMHEEKKVGFNWREILESRGIEYHKDKVKGIRKAMIRYNIIPAMTAWLLATNSKATPIIPGVVFVFDFDGSGLGQNVALTSSWNL